MPWNTTITNTGNTMLQQWASSGETLTVTRANCGNGTVSTSALAAQTALTGTIGDLTIAGKQEVTAGTQYTVQIGPSATGEYTLRQVGLWARLGSGTEGLLAIYQNAEGINVPSQATEPGFLHTLFLTVAMSNQGQLVVQFSAGAYVTHADLPLSVANGGTGRASSPSLLVNLSRTTADTILKASPRPGVTGVLSRANGGTGIANMGNITYLDTSSSGVSVPSGTVTNLLDLSFDTVGTYIVICTIWYPDSFTSGIIRAGTSDFPSEMNSIGPRTDEISAASGHRISLVFPWRETMVPAPTVYINTYQTSGSTRTARAHVDIIPIAGA